MNFVRIFIVGFIFFSSSVSADQWVTGKISRIMDARAENGVLQIQIDLKGIRWQDIAAKGDCDRRFNIQEGYKSVTTSMQKAWYATALSTYLIGKEISLQVSTNAPVSGSVCNVYMVMLGDNLP